MVLSRQNKNSVLAGSSIVRGMLDAGYRDAQHWVAETAAEYSHGNRGKHTCSRTFLITALTTIEA
jgi:hypothetical protein